MTLLILEPPSQPLSRFLQPLDPCQDSITFGQYDEVRSKVKSVAHTLLLGIEYISQAQRRCLMKLLAEMPGIEKVLNPWSNGYPLRVRHLQTLCRAGVNRFGAWYAGDINDANAFPLFLRDATTGHFLSNLIGSTVALRQALEKLSYEHRMSTLAIEFCPDIGADDLYRKYSCFVVGNITIPAHLYLSRHWVVRGRDRVLTRQALEEEHEYLISNPHRDQICRAARLCSVDFARVDYGLRDGRVQIFEFNLNPGPGVSALNRERTERLRGDLVAALKKIAEGGCGGG